MMETLIEYDNYKFLITDAPTNSNLLSYIQLWQKYHIRNVIRLCDSTYDEILVSQKGIQIHDLSFHDGTFPNHSILNKWKHIIISNMDSCIGIHCIAGLGRAPLLVSLTLIELGIDNLESIKIIREKRPGALNTQQLRYIKKYKPKIKLNKEKSKIEKCIIS